MAGKGTINAGSPGTRLSWARLPAPVRAAVEARAGAPVVGFEDQRGGFSPGVAARLQLADENRLFVKSVASHLNQDAPEIYRREARVAAALPSDAPAPRLRESFEVAGWVTLLFECIDGRMPAQPWVQAELDIVVTALDDLADALTPSPMAAPPIGDSLQDEFAQWDRLRAGCPGGPADEWAADNIDLLARLEARWGVAAAGDTLVHTDVRADNILLTDDGRVVFVDWPGACLGAAWVDIVFMAPSVTLAGGPSPDTLLGTSRTASGADPADIDAVVAALAGYFASHSLQPPPAGIPTVREFQAALGEITVRWLRDRLAHR